MATPTPRRLRLGGLNGSGSGRPGLLPEAEVAKERLGDGGVGLKW